jgi:hypothetical protein
MKLGVYEWTRKDRWLYALAMLPFVVVFIGTSYLLATHAIFLFFVFLGLYIITNIFQAGCCVGCPYRGRYCPALCGIYLGNILSSILYKHRRFEPGFFKINATAGEVMIVVVGIYPLYWILQTAWYLVPVYVMLIATHFVLFMSTQCEKCSYNMTCPGGLAWRRLHRHFKRGEAKTRDGI